MQEPVAWIAEGGRAGAAKSEFPLQAVQPQSTINKTSLVNLSSLIYVVASPWVRWADDFLYGITLVLLMYLAVVI